jgi:hypothetical protein
MRSGGKALAYFGSGRVPDRGLRECLYVSMPTDIRIESVGDASLSRVPLGTEA